MRLGVRYNSFRASSISDLERLCPLLDSYGLSAIEAPSRFWEWSDDECWNFGQKAHEFGLVIGETGFWENLLDPNPGVIDRHICVVRSMLRKADIMKVKCVATLVGSRDVTGGPLSPHPYNFSKAAQRAYREICLRIVDNLDLKTTRHATEPWCNTFFYKPREIFDFLGSVNDTRSGLHLDQMNMVSQENYFHTTELINETFSLLSEFIVSVHAKDIRWDPRHKFLKMDEVFIGDGVLDYHTFFHQLKVLDPDMSVYIEHFSSLVEATTAIECIQRAARGAGVIFPPRNSSQVKNL